MKTDAASQPRFATAGCEPFVYDAKTKSVAMSYWSAPPEAMESPALIGAPLTLCAIPPSGSELSFERPGGELMQPWARFAVEAALRARALSKPRRAVPA